jgi:Glycosyl hydrolase family 26
VRCWVTVWLVLSVGMALAGCGGHGVGTGSSPAVGPDAVASAPRAGVTSLPRIVAPPPGKLYHGFYYSTENGHEHGVTPDDVATYETTVEKQVAWVFFSHHWWQGREFPLSHCKWIRGLGKVPYIRLMLLSSDRRVCPDPVYKLQAIINGKFDADLRAWADSAKAFGTPVLAEYGVECNGDWFPWNGRWNGGGTQAGFGDPNEPDGPERFVAAYRHIINLMRGRGATNITWVLQVNNGDSPERAWNRFENYYPGDSYIDWVGISCYGALAPTDRWAEQFRPCFDEAYNRAVAMAPTKPIIIPEFGFPLHHYKIAAADWAHNALDSILGTRYPKLAGFCWWNETWQNDDNPAHDTDMVIWHSTRLSDAFRTQLENHKGRLQQRPVVAG